MCSVEEGWEGNKLHGGGIGYGYCNDYHYH